MRLVCERDRPAVPYRLPQRLELRFLRRQPRLDHGAADGVVLVEARGLELEEGAGGGGGAGQLRALPDAGRDAEHGRLVGFELDVGQLVVLLTDPVAGLLVECVVKAGLQRMPRSRSSSLSREHGA